MISLYQLAIFIPISCLYIGIPMSVCLHRYFSHRAFETSRPVQLVLGLFLLMYRSLLQVSFLTL